MSKIGKLKINKKEQASIWSNVFFLVPLFLAFDQGRILFGALLLFLIFSSGSYHTFKNPGADWWWKVKNRTLFQSLFLYADTLFACLVSIIALMMFADANFPLEFWIAIILFIPAFILYWDTSKNYPIHHAIWHFLVAIIISLAFLA